MGSGKQPGKGQKQIEARRKRQRREREDGGSTRKGRGATMARVMEFET
jgi:hypothetical protein